jgi:hypothetical protein
MQMLTKQQPSNHQDLQSINFLIIGAQKAGTTSLFEYMRRHPEIYMPPEKEIAYFEADLAYRRGFNWFQSQVTGAAPPGVRCGTASVGYMTGTPFRDIPLDDWAPEQTSVEGRIEDVIPERIREVLPDVKLLCVLRDPVQRAISHHRMAVLDGLESQPFDTAITHLMEPRAMQHARSVATGYNGYIARGEYGRILAGFLRLFSREQLKVIFSTDLAEHTRHVLPEVFDFIDVSSDFLPPNLDKRYRVGATQPRIRGLNVKMWQERLAGVQLAQRSWHRVSPRSRGSISRAVGVASYRVELWNARRDPKPEQVDPSVTDALIEHFRADSEALADLLAVEVPWLKTWGQSRC